MLEPLVRPVVEPVLEPVVEPILERIVEPVLEPILERIVEPVPEPVPMPIEEKGKFKVYLRSRALNRYKRLPWPDGYRDIYRHGQPLWEREAEAPFERPYEATIELHDVPIGWAVLEVWAEDDDGYYLTKKKTMQVFVYPEIFCRRALVPVFGPHLGYRTRWFLLPPGAELPPVTPLPEGPRPPVEPILERIRPHQGVYHIRAALWKQCDGYFHGTRYDPAGITDYNHQSPHFSVDGEEVRDSQGNFLGYCGPSNEDPLTGQPSDRCRNTLPQHESERIDLIELKPVELKVAVRAIVGDEKRIEGEEK